MTYAANHQDFASYVDDGAAAKRDAVASKTGVWRRIIDAIFESHQKQTDREIARFLARSGGRITDDLERQIMRHLSASNWSARG